MILVHSEVTCQWAGGDEAGKAGPARLWNDHSSVKSELYPCRDRTGQAAWDRDPSTSHLCWGVSRLITPKLWNFQRVLHTLAATQRVPRHTQLYSRGSTRVLQVRSPCPHSALNSQGAGCHCETYPPLHHWLIFVFLWFHLCRNKSQRVAVSRQAVSRQLHPHPFRNDSEHQLLKGEMYLFLCDSNQLRLLSQQWGYYKCLYSLAKWNEGVCNHCRGWLQPGN